ncbi:MAG TPA: glycosyltransferase, partial [Thermoanaerobaculia bacterium]|nr:glycosyltransferase [Thermoanaerobaculia bacterium]
RLEPMPRGVDRSLFHPGRRREGFWRRYGLGDAPTLLYVGRISKEKNLEALLEAFARLRSSGRRLQLALVGDGPHRKELARRAHRPDVAFTGNLHGAELAAAYASADLFVFPSTTDTFGNAVLEAMASGLPAVVTDRGGPQEIVRRRNAGAVAAPGPAPLAAAVGDLLDAPGRRAEAAGLALETARTSSWDGLLDSLWPAPTEPADPACAKRRRAASGVAA